jgi:hypothetical protein
VSIYSQAIELDWQTEARGKHGEWIADPDAEEWERIDAEHHYVMPDHARLVGGRGKYPDPADHPWFKAHPVSTDNIMHAYHAASASQRNQGLRWYADAHDVAAAIAGGDPHLGAGLLAAYSPQTSWPTNMFNAARSAKLGRAVRPGEGMVMSSQANNAQEVFDGVPYDEGMPSPKINSFAHLIEKGYDDPDDQLGKVVIDRHALSVAAGQRLGKDDTDTLPIGKEAIYQHVADEYRKAAIQASKEEGHTVTPHQMQAITWLVQQQANEAEDAGALTPLQKGRATRTKNAWKEWVTYAGQNQIPVESGTTALSMLDPEGETSYFRTITGQAISLAGDERPR